MSRDRSCEGRDCNTCWDPCCPDSMCQFIDEKFGGECIDTIETAGDNWWEDLDDLY